MLRWTMPFMVVAFAGSALAADLPNAYDGSGATVHRKAPPPYGRQVQVEKDPDVLFTPYLPPPRTPLLPGSAILPGYYGSTHSYEDQGPYYGGPYVGYWNRLPYACGVYGYC
jgi:hypothetical protein